VPAVTEFAPAGYRAPAVTEFAPASRRAGTRCRGCCRAGRDPVPIPDLTQFNLWERIHSRKMVQAIEIWRLYWPIANEFAPTGYRAPALTEFAPASRRARTRCRGCCRAGRDPVPIPDLMQSNLWERIHSRKMVQAIEMWQLYWPIANEFAPTGYGAPALTEALLQQRRITSPFWPSCRPVRTPPAKRR